MIAEHALAAGDADGAVLMLMPAVGRSLRVAAAAGSLIDPSAGASANGAAPAGPVTAESVLSTGTPVSPIPAGDLLVRVGATERVAGVLWLRWSPDRLDRVHESIVDAPKVFAEQVALVLEVALAAGRSGPAGGVRGPRPDRP